MPGPRNPGTGVVCCVGLSASRDIKNSASVARERRPKQKSKPWLRIAGVNLPTNKRVVIALQYIHGIGAKKAPEIMENVTCRRNAGCRN